MKNASAFCGGDIDKFHLLRYSKHIKECYRQTVSPLR